MSALKGALAWSYPFDPSLSDLYLSLGNLDHLHRIIMELQNEYFPSGTGFEGSYGLITLDMTQAQCMLGVQNIAQQNLSLELEAQYVCCTEVHSINKKPFQLIICMFPEMLHGLMNAKYI